MALTETEQTIELLKKSNSILITFRKDWTGDALASALGLSLFIATLDADKKKRVDIVCDNFKITGSFSFLPQVPILPSIENLQKFVITVNTAKTKIGEFYYDYSNGNMNIFITPKNGQLEQKDVTTANSTYTYDLIIVIDSPDLESLGSLYDTNTSFFFAVPKINIDHSAANEYFGNINVIDLTAASTAEIIFGFIKKYNESAITEDMATCFLTGIIAATKNFRLPAVAPQTLHHASDLIAHGARRDAIIQNLYQNRFMSTLKLWGRVLSRLKNTNEDKLVWSIVSAQDFVETATSPSELVDVIEELIVSMPKVEVAVLLYETKNTQGSLVNVIIYTIKNYDARTIGKKFNAAGSNQMAKFSIPQQTLAEAERGVIEEIKNYIK